MYSKPTPTPITIIRRTTKLGKYKWPKCAAHQNTGPHSISAAAAAGKILSQSVPSKKGARASAPPDEKTERTVPPPDTSGPETSIEPYNDNYRVRNNFFFSRAVGPFWVARARQRNLWVSRECFHRGPLSLERETLPSGMVQRKAGRPGKTGTGAGMENREPSTLALVTKGPGLFFSLVFFLRGPVVPGVGRRECSRFQCDRMTRFGAI